MRKWPLVLPAAVGLLASVLIVAPILQGEPQDRYTGDPAGLEPSGRDSWQMPERVMDAVGVRERMIIGEVGAGGGYFTVWLARRVGPNGHVYANDINRSYLDHLTERCADEGLDNVTTILSEETDPLLPAGQLDLVIMVNVYHELYEPLQLMRNILPSLKPGATVVIVDNDVNKRGRSHTSDPVQTLAEVQEASYELVRREDFLPRQYILILRPGGS